MYFPYRFQVIVTIQDVNDNNPVFTQKNYYASVGENAQLNPPTAVLQVNAVDADDGIFGEVKYAFVGNDNSLFQLDPNSGILYPSHSLKGKTGTYRMNVEARDGLGFGPNTDTTGIVIDVQSVNNYRPVFIMPALSNASVEIQEVKSLGRMLFMTTEFFSKLLEFCFCFFESLPFSPIKPPFLPLEPCSHQLPCDDSKSYR